MKSTKQFQFSKVIPLYTMFGKVNAFYFKSKDKEGVVLKNYTPKDKSLHLRLQSSCLFSESFKTIDCDCNRQLEESIKIIVRDKGLIIYVYDEGRGAGLMNKFNSIALQKTHKIDTAKAYKRLGLEKDLRAFKTEVELLGMLFDLEKVSFTLISNNPLKKLKLQKANVKISRVIKAVYPFNNRVKIYLEEKKNALGHDIQID